MAAECGYNELSCYIIDHFEPTSIDINMTKNTFYI